MPLHSLVVMVTKFIKPHAQKLDNPVYPFPISLIAIMAL